MTVEELDERMSEREFAQWAAFYQLEAERAARARQRQANKQKGR